MSRDTFDAIRLIDLRVDGLQVLQQVVSFEELICLSLELLLLAVVLLPVEESASIRATLNRTLRNHFGWDELEDPFYATDLFDRI